MRTKHPPTRARTGMVFLVLAAACGSAAGCAVGPGAPDGWRYLRTGTVDVAHPRRWAETAAGAVLRGPGGRTDAELTVTPATTATASADVPASAHAESLEIDGRPAKVLSYQRRAADGRTVGHVEVRAQDPDGRPVLVRAWVVAGTEHDPMLLRRIVNSIEFTARPR